jgi:general secretion pathway protein F
LLVGCIVLFFAIRWWRHFALTNTLCGRFVAGTASNLLAMSELIGTLALLLELKAPLGLALTIAGRQCKHDYFRQAIQSLAMNAKKGVVSEFPLRAKKRLPPLLLHALRSSESSSPNLPLLHELSAVYRDRARLRRDWITSSGPSLAVFVVGLFVLWLVVGLLSPLFMLNSSFSN